MRFLLAFVLLLTSASPTAGQAVLKGFVREDSTLRPLADVEVIVEGASRPYRTNVAGGYTVWDLSPGRRLVQLRRLGFEPLEETVDLVAGTQERVFYLKRSVVRLDTVVARGPAPRGLGREAFAERQKLGMGRFYDSLTLRKNEHRRLTDLLHDAGVNFVIPPKCGGLLRPPYCDFQPRKRVATNRASGVDCALIVILDGHTQYRGGSSGPTIEWEDTFDVSTVMISSLESVELYRGTAELPIEFGGMNSRCGALVMWTRRR